MTMRWFILALAFCVVQAGTITHHESAAAEIKEVKIETETEAKLVQPNVTGMEEETKGQTKAKQPLIKLRAPSGVPLGTIVAWLPFVTRDSPTYDEKALADSGWHRCDGSEITDPTSPWFGQNTPDLDDRYLRGGPLSMVLTIQEDQIQEHTHNDGGHAHTDPGHTHTDSGHTHADAGHVHEYQDKYLSGDGNIAKGSYWAQGSATRTTATGHANIQSSTANINPNQVEFDPGTSNITGVNVGENGDVRYGEETRPKSSKVAWFLKVSQTEAN